MSDPYKYLKDQKIAAIEMMTNLMSACKVKFITLGTKEIQFRWVSIKAENQYNDLEKLVNKLDEQINGQKSDSDTEIHIEHTGEDNNS